MECAEKVLTGEREKTYKWLAAFLEQLPPDRAERYATAVLEGLKEALALEGNRARDSILVGMQTVLGWRSASVDDAVLTKVSEAV